MICLRLILTRIIMYTYLCVSIRVRRCLSVWLGIVNYVQNKLYWKGENLVMRQNMCFIMMSYVYIYIYIYHYGYLLVNKNKRCAHLNLATYCIVT